MAPEVFEERYSAKADVWSVGCVAYQMAFSTPPWKSLGLTNPVSLFNHVKRTNGPPDANYPTCETVSASRDQDLFKKLLSLCFLRDPQRRPDARGLLFDPFFLEEHILDDDDLCGASLFSPASISSRAGPPRSPYRARLSPARGALSRRNSVGSLHSP
jgi:serine/threonine protein kinase